MDSLDRLYEELILDKSFEPPQTPPFQHYGPPPEWWSYYGCPWTARNPGQHRDIIYRNAKGEKHRINGPAYVSTRYKIEAWYKENKLHREDGPAYIHRDNQVWFYEGKLHRLDGPAVLEYGGPKQYWIHGVKYSPKEYAREIARRKRKGLIK